MEKYKYRAFTAPALIGLMLALITTMVMFSSCTKDKPEAPKRADVLQAGELVLVQGFYLRGAPDAWVYRVDVKLCGKDTTIQVDLKKGEVYGETKFQTNCKVEGWKVVYDGIKRD
jgi:hypothetical protein